MDLKLRKKGGTVFKDRPENMVRNGNRTGAVHIT
jgi:hypothetical protein